MSWFGKQVAAGKRPLKVKQNNRCARCGLRYLTKGYSPAQLQLNLTRYWNKGKLVFDTDGPLAEQTRRKVYDMAIADKMLIQGYHFPFPGRGYVEKSGSGYRLVPAMWNPAI